MTSTSEQVSIGIPKCERGFLNNRVLEAAKEDRWLVGVLGDHFLRTWYALVGAVEPAILLFPHDVEQLLLEVFGTCRFVLSFVYV